MDEDKQRAGTGHLRLKQVAIDTYRENVAYMHRDCAVYRAEGFQALTKIEITDHDHRILAVLNVVDDEHIVGPGELGLSETAFRHFGAEAGISVCVAHAEPPRSIDAVQRKMAGERLSLDDFRAIARDILESGRALHKMNAIIDAQGRHETDFRPGPLQFEVKAPRAGRVTGIDNYQLARIARLAGAPMSKGAGVDLLKKMGDPVEAGDPLYRVHSEVRADFEFAQALIERDNGYTIGDEMPRDHFHTPF